MKYIINKSLGAVHTHTHTGNLLNNINISVNSNRKIKFNIKYNSNIKLVSVLEAG